jgi:cytochrome c oxidase subunit II
MTPPYEQVRPDLGELRVKTQSEGIAQTVLGGPTRAQSIVNDIKCNAKRLKSVLIVLTLFTAASLSIVADDANDQVRQAAAHEFQITSSKYDFSPSSLHVKKGDHVRLVIAALDHDHGFRLDEFHINEKIEKGKTVMVEFRADKTGTFPFRCSNFCGLGHRGMKGTLVVEE